MDLRKIDVLVEERIFGNEVDYEFADDPTYGHKVPARCDKYDEWGVLPFYSSDIGDAWQVVEKFQREEKGFRIQLHRDGKWGCHNHDDGVLLSGWDWPEGPGDGYIDEEADTAPLAICLAALCSVGIEP